MSAIKRPVLHAIIHEPAESDAGVTEEEAEWVESDSECECDDDDDYFSVGSDEPQEEEWSECECVDDDSDEEMVYVPRPTKRRRTSDSGITGGVSGSSDVTKSVDIVDVKLAERDASFFL